MKFSVATVHFMYPQERFSDGKGRTHESGGLEGECADLLQCCFVTTIFIKSTQHYHKRCVVCANFDNLDPIYINHLF